MMQDWNIFGYIIIIWVSIYLAGFAFACLHFLFLSYFLTFFKNVPVGFAIQEEFPLAITGKMLATIYNLLSINKTFPAGKMF